MLRVLLPVSFLVPTLLDVRGISQAGRQESWTVLYSYSPSPESHRTDGRPPRRCWEGLVSHHIPARISSHTHPRASSSSSSSLLFPSSVSSPQCVYQWPRSRAWDASARHQAIHPVRLHTRHQSARVGSIRRRDDKARQLRTKVSPFAARPYRLPNLLTAHNTTRLLPG